MSITKRYDPSEITCAVNLDNPSWAQASAAYQIALSKRTTTAAVLSAATVNLAQAQAQQVVEIANCHCAAQERITTAVEVNNANVYRWNNDWQIAHHLLCVLDNTSPCNVPATPEAPTIPTAPDEVLDEYCVATNAPTYAPTVPSSFTFVTGDGVGGNEIYVGLAFDPYDCARKVRARFPFARGATLPSSGQGACYAEIGEVVESNGSGEFITCLFNGVLRVPRGRLVPHAYVVNDKGTCNATQVPRGGGILEHLPQNTQHSRVVTDSDGFGSKIATDGNTLVFASEKWNLNAGRVWVYNGCGLQSTLDQGNSTQSEGFGSDVAIQDGTLVVGWNGLSHSQNGQLQAGGSFVIYERNDTDGNETWVQSQVMDCPGAGLNAKCGTSVAIDDDWIVVGAPFQDDSSQFATQYGAIHIYRRQESGQFTHVQGPLFGVPDQQLASFQDGINGQFGKSIAIDRHTIIVGAPTQALHNGTSVLNNVGNAYAFRLTTDGTWGHAGSFRRPQPESNDQYGYSVALSGDFAVVGAPKTHGEAFMFYNNHAYHSFEFSANLLPRRQPHRNSTRTQSAFGTSVDIMGNIVAIGAPRETAGGIRDKGAVYIFVKAAGSSGSNTRWLQTQRINATDDGSDDDCPDAPNGCRNVGFGHDVSLDGRKMITAAPDKQGPGGKARAYIYSFEAIG